MNNSDRPPRILMIDDDEDFVLSIRNHLEALPSRPTIAYSGNEAVDMFLDPSTTDDPYKLVILDMWVPHERGEEVDVEFGKRFLLDLQQTFGLVSNSTPIIIFTGNDRYDDCVRCIRLGAVDYIPKTTPIDYSGSKESTQYPPKRTPRMVDIFLERCRELLSNTESSGTLTSFLKAKGADFGEEFDGKFVGVVGDQDRARVLEVKDQLELEDEVQVIEFDESVMFVGDNWQNVRHSILKNPEIRWIDVEITQIPYLEVL